MHMAISKLLSERPEDNDCDLRIHSGLIEVRLRAMTIKDKIDWKNALSKSMKQPQDINRNMARNSTSLFKSIAAPTSRPTLGPKSIFSSDKITANPKAPLSQRMPFDLE